MNNQMIHINFKKKTQFCSTLCCSCYCLIDHTKYSRVMTESLLVLVIDHLRRKKRMQKSANKHFKVKNSRQGI